MAWVGIVMAILELLAKLPELIAKIREIFETFKRVPRMKIVYEAKKLADACKAKVESQALAAGECPVEAFLVDLQKRYP